MTANALFLADAAVLFAELGEAATYHVDATGEDISLTVLVHRDVQPEIVDMTMQTPEPRTEVDVQKADLSALPTRGDTITLTESGEVLTVRQRPIRDDNVVYRLVVRT